ncbi:porin [Foetidibacter luteolus]|uniref:porin n=1 Tax=Foetidibacter luteolus TaxID=2608880 RepID=UPI00129BE8A5|nr:porin [Foetidibacter luteolus]
MKKSLIVCAAILATGYVCAQDSTKHNPLTIGGYVEAYYSYDFNRPANNNKSYFLYSHNRNNEVNLNLGFVKAAYNMDKVRANLSLAVGSYINANYAAEPGVLRNIYEANAGVKISKTGNLWIDAGIFPSHIGFESAISKDCWTLTRSIPAENSPYFESGAKMSYTSNNDKWFLSAMYLNGWQRITRVNGNTTPAFGTQVTYKPSDKVALNYSTFIGNDKPDSIKQMRYFHNFYGIFQVSKQLGIIAGFDYGMEQKAKGSSRMNNWYSPVVMLRINADDKNALAIRGEYYSDANGVIVASGTANGFKTFGWSINYDRLIAGNAVWRTEYRILKGQDKYFARADNSLTGVNGFITTSLAVNL